MYWPQLSQELFTEQIISALRGETAPWSHYNRQLMVMGRGENAQRYQESDVTLRRYIEDKQETEPETVRGRLFLPYAALGHLKHVQGQKYPHLLGRKAKKQNEKNKNRTTFRRCAFSTATEPTMSVQAVERDLTVSGGRRRIHNAAPPDPTLSVSSLPLIQNMLPTRLITRVLFIQVIEKEKKKISIYIENKRLSLRCTKRSILSTTSTDQHLQHLKFELSKTWRRSKSMQHSSPFPVKAFGNNLSVRSYPRATRTQKLLLTTQGPFSFSVMAASSVIIPTFEAKKRKEEKKPFVPLTIEAKLSVLASTLLLLLIDLAYTGSQNGEKDRFILGGVEGGSMMRNVPCAQLTTCTNLTVLTELESDTTKNMLARCKQRIYSKCNYKSFGMVGLFIIIRIVYVQKRKKYL